MGSHTMTCWGKLQGKTTNLLKTSYTTAQKYLLTYKIMEKLKVWLIKQKDNKKHYILVNYKCKFKHFFHLCGHLSFLLRLNKFR